MIPFVTQTRRGKCLKSSRNLSEKSAAVKNWVQLILLILLSTTPPLYPLLPPLWPTPKRRITKTKYWIFIFKLKRISGLFLFSFKAFYNIILDRKELFVAILWSIFVQYWYSYLAFFFFWIYLGTYFYWFKLTKSQSCFYFYISVQCCYLDRSRIVV